MSPPEDLDPGAVERLTTQEVLALARVSKATLWRRIAQGRLPAPVDRGRQALFVRAAVLEALRVSNQTPLSHTLATEDRLEALRRRQRPRLSA